MKNLYELVCSDWDDSLRFLCTSELNLTQDEFREVCRSLIPECAQLILKKRSGKQDLPITGFDLLRELVVLLEDMGFEIFKPKNCVFLGTDLSENSQADMMKYLDNFAYSVANYNRVVEALYPPVSLEREISDPDQTQETPIKDVLRAVASL